MVLVLGPEFPFSWQGTPPHMSREDYEIWVRFRQKIKPEPIRMYFDVGAGGTVLQVPEEEKAYAGSWTRNTQKRIDVLLEYPTKWVILELRMNAQSSVIGRLLMYRDLWIKEALDKKEVELWLVTNSLDPDVKTLAASIDILTFEA